MNKGILRLFFTLLAVFVVSTNAMAQDDPVDAEFRISFMGMDQVKYKQVQYALFKTENKANEVLAALEKAVADQRGDNGSIIMTAWDDAVAKYKIKFKRSKGNGEFKVHAYPDMAVVITSFLPNDELTIEDAVFKVITLKAGQAEYEHMFGGKGEKRDMTKGNHVLDGVTKIGHNKDTINITAAPPIDDGKKMYFPIRVVLPQGHVDSRSRLIIQPMAVDCQTEDTVNYISGLLYEGVDYHKVQNKRMAYKFMKNDNIAYAYVDKPLFYEEKTVIDTMLVYTKPNPRISYKIPYRVVVADANHVFIDKGASTGSCNKKNIFKFLELGIASADMDVDEFRIDAESNFDTKNQDLRLRFQLGKSELTNDSINDKIMNTLVEELRSYGDQLTAVTVEGTASPEGGLDSNKRLATARSGVAGQLIRRKLGKVDIAFHTNPARVYTWEDVAKELEDAGKKEMADAVRSNMGSDGYGGDAAIKALPYYDSDISPILEGQRLMRVTYRYEKEHIMDADEVTAAYYQRKADLLKGKGRDFSDGDYYNLFATMRDSAEIDTLTILAYNHCIKHKGYEQIKFSMYAANKYAILMQKLGRPDPDILRPFVNMRSRVVNGRERSEDAQKNRREVLINQIITYFQVEERDSALSCLNYWFAKDEDPKVKKMKQYVTFKENFIKYATKSMTPAEESEFMEALDFVLSCSPDNKAVLYTEAREYMNIPNSECETLVRAMKDDNPKKWYLMGILRADDEMRMLGIKKNKDYVPEYLAFFHHSFVLDKTFKRHYFTDGQVSDELRKEFKYRKKDIPRYEEIFNSLVTLTDPTGESQQNSNEIEISGDDDEPTNNEENSNTDATNVDAPAAAPEQ